MKKLFQYYTMCFNSQRPASSLLSLFTGCSFLSASVVWSTYVLWGKLVMNCPYRDQQSCLNLQLWKATPTLTPLHLMLLMVSLVCCDCLGWWWNLIIFCFHDNSGMLHECLVLQTRGQTVFWDSPSLTHTQPS